MALVTESTTANEERDVSPAKPRAPAPSTELGGGQAGGPFGQLLSGALSDSMGNGGGGILFNQKLAHPANGPVRSIALKRAQHTHGNHFLQRAVAQRKPNSNQIIQRDCACGGTCASCQTAVSTTAPSSDAVGLSISRKSIQLQSSSPPQSPLSSTTTTAAGSNTLSGSGKPLEEGPRDLMESRFGEDFSAVRIHSDDAASEAADRLDANAFTTGRDIYFGRGRYQPNSREGQHLLAHELTHTIQQSTGRVPSGDNLNLREATVTVGAATDPLEAEADRAADAVVGGTTPDIGLVATASTSMQRQVVLQREPRDVFAGKSYDLKTNKGVLAMAWDWQTQFIQDWANSPEGSKAKTQAGRAMAIYTDHFLKKFQKLAEEGAKPELLVQEVLAGVNRSLAAAGSEAESKKFIDVKSYRTWFPEHYSAEYFEEGRKLRHEQQERYAINEFYKLQHLHDEKEYTDWAEYQYWQGFLADLLDEEGLRILAGKWDSLVFKDHRIIFLSEAWRKSRALGQEEWQKYRMLAPFPGLAKEELAETQYADIVKKLNELVALKKGLLTGETPREQEPWINGRIEDLIGRLNAEFGIQMGRAQLLESVLAGKELRVIGGHVQRSPEGEPHFGQRMTFRAVLDYMPPGRTVRLGWRWKTGGQEFQFFSSGERSPVTESVTLDVAFWNFQTMSVKEKGGLEVLAHVYVGDQDKPAGTISTGWIALTEEAAPTEIHILNAPETTVQDATVKFAFGPTIPPHSNYSADWYVDGHLKAEDFWAFNHKFESTGESTVVLKLSQVERSFGIRDKKPFLESPPVKIKVLDPTEFGESILSQLDKPLVPGMSAGSLKQLESSTQESIKQLEQKVAMAGDDRKHWESRLETQQARLRKIHELVPDLAQIEELPKDKLELTNDRLYSMPISSVLIHPEKGVTLPLAIYLTVKCTDSGCSASLIDATSSKILRFSGSGGKPQDAYVSVFSAWQSNNEYPTGGQVVYRFDPVVFTRGSGSPEKRSFSTSTTWKVAKEWWDGILTVGGIIVGGLLLLAPEATITKVLGIALLAAATARSVVAIKERMEIGYGALDKENLLDGIAIAASVTGIGGTVIKSVGLRAARPLIARVGNSLIIASTAADVGTFVYASSEAIAALRAIDADPTLDDAQKQVELLRVMATLFMTGALMVATNKDLIKGKSSIKSKLEPGAKVELDAATRIDMELELKAAGEHESFLKSVEGMDPAARDRALLERLIDVKARAGLKPTEENVRRVDDPKYSADYDAEIVEGGHTYRRSKKSGHWCRFSNGPVCGIHLTDINPEVDALLAKKPIVTPDKPPETSIEAITTDAGPQVAPAKAGAAAGALPPGMPAHKAARWAEYQKRGGNWTYERWSELYELRIQEKRAEVQKELVDLQATKDAAEARSNELKKKAKEAEDRANELDRQAAIAKGDKQTQLRQQWRQEREAAEKAQKDADSAFKEAVDAQLKIQQKRAQLNLDARSRLPCFAAGTSVWTPEGSRAIEELRVDDVVLAYDFKLRSTIRRNVLEVFQNQTMRFFDVEVGGATIRSTSLHRFWVESESEWVETRKLRVGMELLTMSGKTEPITRIDLHEAPLATTYNLHIQESCTYFVGVGVLVHNQGQSYSFGNLRIYAGVNPNFPGLVYIGQTDDLVRRQQEHRDEAIEKLKNPNLTKEQREFWEFKRDIVLEERVSGLNPDQANYLEQKNIDIEKSAQGEDNVMNRREQVSRKNLPELEKKIIDDPAVKAAGLCP